ncbi:MAG: PLP-dependent aminotransferase family protein [Ilumatobacter sp.]|uniref:MocR-like pyridoxine biosynthesis transcription factor PdxR n=1 Tax=Ilumatobacter sp. TaxID=1967498 RepID=UPI003C7518D1
MLDLQLDVPAGGGRREALETALRRSIRSGRLAPGAAIPSTRSLATDLGVSRSTVVAAYDQLVAEGYLSAARGSATRVASLRSPTTPDEDDDLFGPTPLHDFRPGEPAAGSFPRSRWLRSVRRVLNDAPDATLGYADPRGIDELRSALADHLRRTRTVVASRQAVHVVGGYGAGLGFLAETLRRRGVRRIAIEDPMLPMHVHTLRSAGLETVPIPLDADGIDVDLLCAADVAAVVVTPAHQYPTAITMSPRRRTEIIGWARDRDAWIIEDDYDGEFRYDRRPIGSLQGLGPDRVVYGGTVSKSLSPALRLGWLVVPEPLRGDLLAVINIRAGVSAVDQLALADFLQRGELDRHVRSMRGVYRRRNDDLRTLLARSAPWLDVGAGEAGLHLIANLRSAQLDEATVLAAADAASVGLLGLVTHHRSTAAGDGFAIGFSRPAEHHFAAALDRLGEVLSAL